MKIEVVDSPGCTKCKKAKEVARKVASEYGLEYRELHVFKDVERIVELGVVITPTIAIDGEIVFTKIPKEDELREKVLELGGRK
jgi:small redox-active disulfide protein 2